jgi:hypothetical protein
MGTLGDRLLQVGGVIFASGVSIGAGWGVLAAQVATIDLWNWPMWAGLVMAGIGAITMLVSFFIPSGDEGRSQTQHGGAGSTNIQAGGDVVYTPRREE